MFTNFHGHLLTQSVSFHFCKCAFVALDASTTVFDIEIV